ncbi:MAG: nucleotidyltransferase substrate binding protein [Bdellovibrionota bacterium]
MAVSLEQYEKALDSLAKALQEDKNDIVRDASIQRFEFCIELAWKTAKKNGNKCNGS